MDDTSKVCTRCGELKALDQFTRAKSGRLGRRADCIECVKAYKRSDHSRELDRIRDRKRYALDGLERQREYLQRPEVRERKREYARLYYARNQKVWRIKENARNRGITEEDYLEALREQGGRCAICGQPPTIGRKGPDKFARLHIDHDHTTKQFRGLLCHLCNIGLGHFKDDPALLAEAIKYLQQKR